MAARVGCCGGVRRRGGATGRRGRPDRLGAAPRRSLGAVEGDDRDAATAPATSNGHRQTANQHVVVTGAADSNGRSPSRPHHYPRGPATTRRGHDVPRVARPGVPGVTITDPAEAVDTGRHICLDLTGRRAGPTSNPNTAATTPLLHRGRHTRLFLPPSPPTAPSTALRYFGARSSRPTMGTGTSSPRPPSE